MYYFNKKCKYAYINKIQPKKKSENLRKPLRTNHKRQTHWPPILLSIRLVFTVFVVRCIRCVHVLRCSCVFGRLCKCNGVGVRVGTNWDKSHLAKQMWIKSKSKHTDSERDKRKRNKNILTFPYIHNRTYTRTYTQCVSIFPLKLLIIIIFLLVASIESHEECSSHCNKIK